MSSNHDYRLRDKDKWTKKEFEKIFSNSNLIWPSGGMGGKGAPTNLSRVYVEVRTPYDGILIEGMINKLARKNLSKFQDGVPQEKIATLLSR